ncbi:hypothetical protein SMI01S_09160 [Sphingobacterium mizutaii NBRC 14946 = DSM 11724]|uniref:Uncharacterized protein n=1 Tax=Sphingobacterium mizutaii NBRC 14946 = DSM 11724 TaxID=1220576 RepID=A0ABQ0W0E1_9SPHI|nr:hypothetical protein SMI01S_09160 [Sphingobacterium mizutaii NBRC 14946 = DSM 11724]
MITDLCLVLCKNVSKQDLLKDIMSSKNSKKGDQAILNESSSLVNKAISDPKIKAIAINFRR